MTVRNTGSREGKEVVQLYISDLVASLTPDVKRLRGFEKINLQPGESKTVTISLNENAFQYYDDIKNDWVKEKDSYDILVGGSSRSIKLMGKVKL